jgi:hypothetical protein
VPCLSLGRQCVCRWSVSVAGQTVCLSLECVCRRVAGQTPIEPAPLTGHWLNECLSSHAQGRGADGPRLIFKIQGAARASDHSTRAAGRRIETRTAALEGGAVRPDSGIRISRPPPPPGFAVSNAGSRAGPCTGRIISGPDCQQPPRERQRHSFPSIAGRRADRSHHSRRRTPSSSAPP